MREKFENKYRIQSSRLKNWDYKCCAPYFVTICTKQRENYFGRIVQGKMNFSSIGERAYQLWHEIPHHSHFVVLDEFTIMPNHIHGIIIINNFSNECRSTKNSPVDYNSKQLKMSSISPKSGSLSSVIRSYKSAVSKWSREQNLEFKWQERFHDRIIRNQEELDKIRNYIVNNPGNWELE